MFKAYVRNLITGETFIKEFASPYLLRKFVNKCRYSKKVKVIYSDLDLY